MINPQQYTDDKLIILYILNKIKSGLTKEQIAYIIIQNIQINYFDIQINIHALSEKGLIIEYKKDKTVFYISKSGMNVLNELENIIPAYTKELIDRYITESTDISSNPTEITADYSQNGEFDFQIDLSIIENNIQLMAIALSVPTKETAEIICQKWKTDTQKIYASVIKILNEN